MAKQEKELQRQIESYLRLKEIVVGRQRMDRRSNLIEGYPDIWFVYRNVPYAFEVKVGTHKQTNEQRALQPLMEANGWRYHVVRSLEQVKEILQAKA